MVITVVIPVKNPINLSEFIKRNETILLSNIVVVIDSGGGELLKDYADIYLQRNMTLTEARKYGYSFVNTEYTLNLDSDVVFPSSFIDFALSLLNEHGNVGAVSIFYENVVHCQGSLEFGISLWRTKLLKELYDFSFQKNGQIVKVGPSHFASLNNGWCECNYMWRKLKNAGWRLETLPVRAIHLREI